MRGSAASRASEPCAQARQPATAPAGSTWPEPGWARRLADFAAGLDQRFVHSGQVLSQAIDTIYAMFDGLDALADVLNPQIAGAAVEGLHGVAGKLTELPFELAQRGEELAVASRLVKALGGHIEDIQRALKILEVYGMNIKIAGAGGNFRIFVDDMGGKLKLGGEQVDSFADRLDQVGTHLAKVRESDVRVREAYRRSGDHVPARLDGCAHALESHLVGIARMISAMTDITHQVEDGIGAVLSAIQVGDSTRQRIEHIVVMIETVEADPTVPETALAHVAGLVAAQIMATSSAFLHESRELRNALQILGSCGAELTAIVEQLAGHDGNSPLQELEKNIAEISPMTDELREMAHRSAEMNSEVGAALDELGERLGSIDQTVRDVKEIAINTRLLCKQQGTEGVAVAVIAVEVAVQARHLQDAAAAVAEAISRLGTLNGGLRDPGADENRRDLGMMLDQVLATMHEVCQQSDLAIARGDASGRALIGQLDDATAAASADPARDVVLTEAAHAFGAIPPRAADAGSEAWLREVLPRLGAIYTMAAEREVHAGFLPAGMEEAGVPAAVDDVDEDGLF